MIEVLMMDVGAPMSAVGTWIELKPIGTKPSGRHGHRSTSVGDKLYLYGGRVGGNTNRNDLWEYTVPE